MAVIQRTYETISGAHSQEVTLSSLTKNKMQLITKDKSTLSRQQKSGIGKLYWEYPRE